MIVKPSLLNTVIHFPQSHRQVIIKTMTFHTLPFDSSIMPSVPVLE
jgi:hypothetical protein